MPDNDDTNESGGEPSSTPREGGDVPPEASPQGQPENRRARRAAASSSRKKGQRGRPGPRPEESGLATGEMVDDALSRAADGSARWLKDHFNIVQWLVVASIAGWIGWQIYSWRADKTAVKISDSLSEAVDAEFGRIGSPDDEGKVDARGSVDTRRVFGTDDERLKASAEAYQHVATERAGSPAADLAKLGLAGVLYDQGKYEDARKLYQEVASSELVKKNPEARGRSLEGTGLALEALGDKDGALKRYGELENADIPGFRELALYDQARLLHAKGDNAGAKERLKKVVEKLDKEKEPLAMTTPGQGSYLAEASRALLMSIDPGAMPAQSSDDALRRALEEFQKKLPTGRDEPSDARAGISMIRARVVASGVLGALLAAGATSCGSLRATANPEVPSWMHRPSWSISTVYSQRLDAASRAETEPYQRGRPELDVARRRVFVGSSDRGLYAVRAEDGSVIWRFETLGVVQCEPLYDPEEDVVYFGSNDGALYKVHASDGALIWRFETNAEVARRPVIVGSTVYAVNANDTVLALNRETGARRWSQHRAPALGMEVSGYAGPLVWRGLVYAGFSDGNVSAYDAETGAERWQPVDLSAEAEEALGDVPRYLDVDTTPVPGVIDESPVVFVGSYDGGVYALDADSGNKVWGRTEVTGVSDVVLWHQPAYMPRDGGPQEPARDLLLASAGTTGLWALDPKTGEDVWHRPLPDGGVSVPVPIAGALLVSTTLHGLFLVSPLDGSVIDGIHTGAGFSMAPAVHGLRAFVFSNSGNLMSLHVTPPA